MHVVGYFYDPVGSLHVLRKDTYVCLCIFKDYLKLLVDEPRPLVELKRTPNISSFLLAL